MRGEDLASTANIVLGPSAAANARLTVLGCGSSGGVPRFGGPDGAGQWGACDPTEPKNRRRRCALLVERFSDDGVTRVLVDTGPDMRQQLLDARAPTLDAVLYTHDHADHTHGLDDLRQVVFQTRQRLVVWADRRTREVLETRFAYAFHTPEGSPYPPILDMREITANRIETAEPIVVDGAGGSISATPFEVEHGHIPSLGFRFGGAAYLPDVSAMTAGAWAAVEGLELWILDCLRYTPHKTHANLETALGWIKQAEPERAVLTNLHVDLDYATLAGETPDHITPAFDGLTIAARLP